MHDIVFRTKVTITSRSLVSCLGQVLGGDFSLHVCLLTPGWLSRSLRHVLCSSDFLFVYLIACRSSFVFVRWHFPPERKRESKGTRLILCFKLWISLAVSGYMSHMSDASLSCCLCHLQLLTAGMSGHQKITHTVSLAGLQLFQLCPVCRISINLSVSIWVT